MNISECMEFISSYSKSGGRITDLSRARQLMDNIGNPEKHLKFVHVAGTNGKGSVVEYVSNALILAGYKTGQFTSPFILRYTDRIRINGSEIDEDSLCEIAEYVREKAEDSPYSQFEITMAIALLWYVREGCDVVVLETGIGGDLDCTNVIPPPLLSVITAVSLDHTAILGDTVEEIATHKAGIIKGGSAVIVSDDNPDSVKDIIRRTAAEKGAKFIEPEPCKPAPDGGLYSAFLYRGVKLTPAMAGLHQKYNAQTAITACLYLRSLGYEIGDWAIIRAIEETQVRARVQLIKGEPDVIVDGGHNPAGVEMLSLVMMYLTTRNRPVYAVMGMLKSKDFVSCVKKLAPNCEKVIAVDGFAPDCVPAADLADLAGFFTASETSASLESAVEQAKTLALEKGGIVVVCGSLYLASEYLNKF